MRRASLIGCVASLVCSCSFIDDYGKFTVADGAAVDAGLSVPRDAGPATDGGSSPECTPACALDQRCTAGACEADPILHLRAGGGQNCVVTASGRARCWGSNFDGYLGRPIDAAHSSVGVPPGDMDLTDIADVTMASSHTCALTHPGELYCMGNNIAALGIGRGAATEVATPTRVSFGSGTAGPVTLVNAGDYSTCAIVGDADLWCWGASNTGLIAPPGGSALDRPAQMVAQPTLGTVASIAVGYDSACIRAGATNAMACWGSNTSLQLGVGSSPVETHVPQQVDGTFLQVDVGNAFACAITADTPATLRCWGANNWGQLGIGMETSDPQPATPVLFDTMTPVMVATGDEFACAIGRVASGTGTSVYCWGHNTAGECGQETSVVWVSAPTRVLGADNARAIAVGEAHACALFDEASGRQTVKCWGSNGYAQLGVPYETIDHSVTPVTVP